MAGCAAAMGNWQTGTIKMGTIQSIGSINSIESFLQARKAHNGLPNGALYPDPTVTDLSVRENSNWAKIAAAAVATINTLAAYDIAQKQLSIARQYFNISRQSWDRFRTVYGACERREMNEACGTPEYTPQYIRVSNAYMDEVTRQFSTADGNIRDLVDLYCLPVDSSLEQDIALITAQIRGDSGNFALRREEAREITKNDVRWERRSQALNRGRDIQSTAASYAKAASDGYSGLSDSIGKATDGAMTAIGYFANRNQTNYPGPRTMVNQPPQSPINYGEGGGSFGIGSSVSNIISGASSGLEGYANGSTYYSTNNVITSKTGSQTNGGN